MLDNLSKQLLCMSNGKVKTVVAYSSMSVKHIIVSEYVGILKNNYVLNPLKRELKLRYVCFM